MFQKRKCYSLMWMNNTQFERMLMLLDDAQHNADVDGDCRALQKGRWRQQQQQWIARRRINCSSQIDFEHFHLHTARIFWEHTLHMLAPNAVVLAEVFAFPSIKCVTKCWIFTSIRHNYYYYMIIACEHTHSFNNIFVLSAEQIE